MPGCRSGSRFPRRNPSDPPGSGSSPHCQCPFRSFHLLPEPSGWRKRKQNPRSALPDKGCRNCILSLPRLSSPSRLYHLPPCPARTLPAPLHSATCRSQHIPSARKRPPDPWSPLPGLSGKNGFRRSNRPQKKMAFRTS